MLNQISVAYNNKTFELLGVANFDFLIKHILPKFLIDDLLNDIGFFVLPENLSIEQLNQCMIDSKYFKAMLEKLDITQVIN